MKPLRCLIADDEPPALDLLAGYVQATDFLRLDHRCWSAEEAMRILEREPIDLAFLDIHMPGYSGLELARRSPSNVRVIFTTAHARYAIDGFKVDALDYLLKPFNYEEFLAAALKAKLWFEREHKLAQHQLEFIVVRAEYQRLRIDLDDVLYVEGLKDYVKIWLKDKPKPVLTRMNLKAIGAQLPPHRFMRVHRSFIVALGKISSIERGELVIGDKRISIARPYKAAVKDYLGQRS